MSDTPFLDLMSLEQQADDHFIAPIAPESSGTMFGGQFLAQGLVAAGRTVASDRQPHSLHAYFLRPGDIDAPTEIRVERIRDGRSFSSRAMSATQNGKELFRMLISYHILEGGVSYDAAKMPSVPPPESVSFTYAEFTSEERGNDDFVDRRESKRPWDILYINPPEEELGVRVTEDQLMWMRIGEPLAQELQHAALSYLSDATLIDHVTLPHGLRWGSDEVTGTSLDHGMWFYREIKADEWLLFEQHVECSGDARGLVTGRFFTQDGQLVATCIQEGLVRMSSGV